MTEMALSGHNRTFNMGQIASRHAIDPPAGTYRVRVAGFIIGPFGMPLAHGWPAFLF